jgi:hypothetical protein
MTWFALWFITLAREWLPRIPSPGVIFWLALIIASLATTVWVSTWANKLDRDLYTQDQSQGGDEDWP